jgi:hypothetical protein
MIVFSNLVTLAIAWWQGWPLVMLLWPFFIQNLVIGWYACRRILALHDFRFSLIGNMDKGDPEATKKHAVRSFAFMWGIAHTLYFAFLLGATSGRMRRVPGYDLTALDLAWLAGLALSFALSHRAAFARQLDADRRGRPSIGVLSVFPYLRCVPVHLMIASGLTLGHGYAILLFGLLKTAIDLAMHWVEQHLLSSAAVKSRS